MGTTNPSTSYRHPLPYLTPIQHHKPLQLNPKHNKIPPLHNPLINTGPILQNNINPILCDNNHQYNFDKFPSRIEN